MFNTAWSRAMPVIQKLAENFPDLYFEYCWADEDLGVNVGMAEFENGEVTFDEFYNAHSYDAYELAADLWDIDLAEEGFVFNEETRSYDYCPDEPDESPKME